MRSETTGARGQKIRQETSDLREKEVKGVSADEALKGRSMGGSSTDLSHSITSGGKVPKS
jgi:hypothetical protein